MDTHIGVSIVNESAVGFEASPVVAGCFVLGGQVGRSGSHCATLANGGVGRTDDFVTLIDRGQAASSVLADRAARDHRWLNPAMLSSDLVWPHRRQA